MIKDANFAVIVYDSTNQKSFTSLGTWVDILKKANNNKDLPGVVISTKSDLTSIKAVQSQEGKDLAKKLDMPFFELNCFDYPAIQNALDQLAQKVK
jgi:GTPase SAR1 family protein